MHLGREILTVKALRGTREETRHQTALGNPGLEREQCDGQAGGNEANTAASIDRMAIHDLRFRGLSMQAERSPITISSPCGMQSSTPGCSFRPILLLSHHPE